MQKVGLDGGNPWREEPKEEEEESTFNTINKL